MDTPLDDLGPILVPTPDWVAEVEGFVRAHHQRSEDVLERVETPAEQERFAAIRDRDEVPASGLTLMKEELLAVIKYWENEVRIVRFSEWCCQCFSSEPMRLGSMRDDRIEQIAALIGIEAVWRAIDEAFNEFDFHHQGGPRYTKPGDPENYVASLWRCYLSERHPDRWGPASPEDLAALERYREQTQEAGAPGNEPTDLPGPS